MLFTDVSSKQAVQAFQKTGFWILRSGKNIGMTDGKRKIVIPRHTRVNPFTLKAIIRDAGLIDADFKKLL